MNARNLITSAVVLLPFFCHAQEIPKCDPTLPVKSSPLEVISDIKGVDFGPYLENVLIVIRRNWYSTIPGRAMPPQLEQGCVAIRFRIQKDGKIAEIGYDSTSGDAALDRAAYGAVSASVPFSPLPRQFTGPDIGLRLTFEYNPGPYGAASKAPERQHSQHLPPNTVAEPAVLTTSEVDAPAAKRTNYPDSSGPQIYVVKDGVIPPKLISGTDPKYPKKARKSKKDGKVVLSVVIGIDGKPQEITVKEAPDNEFAGCATDAVRKWRFKPGTKDGKPVPVLISVDVSFHMS